jgi:hypothetical protein
MKLPFLKIKKDTNLDVTKLRSALFDTEKIWFITLVSFFVLTIIAFLVGFDLFYFVYSEGYKKQNLEELNKSPINVEILKEAIEKRDRFIDSDVVLPRDPAI